ncbi:hypothetical protein GM661_12940 [Iocasia frigidifontis]|uniref:Flavoprotein domain-containing protein n=1 Tax=Iocasia fonsfrigidae TaxID=2682810 RepID=A0A8A7KAG5_9FIRM|nr:flavoprotein [Iocasia fonsfrigidae]QTL98803.1 hypothetical protein GM661_12940 [Iocasia fonsfrigidae]
MVEVSKELIKTIVLELIEGLKGIKDKKRVLIVYTGGEIGFKKSLAQIKQLDRLFEIEWEIVLSETAKEILDIQLLKDILAIDKIAEKDIFTHLNNFDLVLVPVLTRNSAAKIASHMTDTLATNIIFKAILIGTPVVAAQNAADLTDPVLMKLGVDHIPQAVLNKNKEYLALLRDYGICLVDVSKLTVEVEYIFSGNTNSSLPNSVFLDKSLLTYSDINKLDSSNKKILVKTDTIITPYARELAASKGLIICMQQE